MNQVTKKMVGGLIETAAHLNGCRIIAVELAVDAKGRRWTRQLPRRRWTTPRQGAPRMRTAQMRSNSALGRSSVLLSWLHFRLLFLLHWPLDSFWVTDKTPYPWFYPSLSNKVKISRTELRSNVRLNRTIHILFIEIKMRAHTHTTNRNRKANH